MSSAVFSTSAAQGRPFVFDSENGVEVCPEPSQQELFTQARPPQRIASTDLSKTLISKALISRALKDARLGNVTPASRLAARPAPEMVSSGIAAIDALTGGLPRGCLTEICGPPSSGRSTLMLSALTAATQRGEFCAVVDASDALDPQSVVAAGIELERLLWVRCGEKSHHAGHRLEQHRLEQLLRVTDLLLESGGFGLIALDLGDLPTQTARRIPLATWFRFRRAVEHTSTVLLAVERQSIAGSCSSLLIKLGSLNMGWLKPGSSDLDSLNLGSSENPANVPTHAQLLTNVEITAELVRSRMERKQARSAEVTFASKTAWAG
jgi:recombination protein RecA